MFCWSHHWTTTGEVGTVCTMHTHSRQVKMECHSTKINIWEQKVEDGWLSDTIPYQTPVELQTDNWLERPQRFLQASKRAKNKVYNICLSHKLKRREPATIYLRSTCSREMNLFNQNTWFCFTWASTLTLSIPSPDTPQTHNAPPLHAHGLHLNSIDTLPY